MLTCRFHAVFVLESMDAGDVRMIQRRQELGFALEPRETICVAREFFRKDFNGNVAIELGVARAVDLAHTTFTDGLQDLVVREFLTSFERHSVDDDTPMVGSRRVVRSPAKGRRLSFSARTDRRGGLNFTGSS